MLMPVLRVKAIKSTIADAKVVEVNKFSNVNSSAILRTSLLPKNVKATMLFKS